MRTFSKTALISASAAGFLCLGCFFASPEAGNGAYTPGATCGARAHDKKPKAEAKPEFPPAPPGELVPRREGLKGRELALFFFMCLGILYPGNALGI